MLIVEVNADPGTKLRHRNTTRAAHYQQSDEDDVRAISLSQGGVVHRQSGYKCPEVGKLPTGRSAYVDETTLLDREYNMKQERKFHLIL